MLEGTSMFWGARRWPLARPWLERWGDRVIAGGLILCFLPLMIIVVIAIKCESRGPALLWEQRVGPQGQRFWALRFRTVHNESTPLRCKQEVTFVGNIIHMLRLDTLPQLVNVLRGEMTCIPGDPDCLFFLE
jgi:lipopolysaccharide/colanic/teichoic acid biosynthesis glycosyltransferase